METYFWTAWMILPSLVVVFSEKERHIDNKLRCKSLERTGTLEGCAKRLAVRNKEGNIAGNSTDFSANLIKLDHCNVRLGYHISPTHARQ